MTSEHARRPHARALVADAPERPTPARPVDERAYARLLDAGPAARTSVAAYGATSRAGAR